jgi:hypothetical protein
VQIECWRKTADAEKDDFVGMQVVPLKKAQTTVLSSHNDVLCNHYDLDLSLIIPLLSLVLSFSAMPH